MNRKSLSLILGLLTSSLAWCQPSLAQTADSANPLSDFQTNTNADPFSTGGGNNSGMFNLMHRAMQGGFSIDLEDVRTSQQNNLNDATSAFLKQRQQLLQAQPQLGATTQATQPASTSPAITPQSPESLVPDAPTAAPPTSTP